jgi:hypothetical protein
MLHSTDAFIKWYCDFRAIFTVITLRSEFGHSLSVVLRKFLESLGSDATVAELYAMATFCIKSL